MRILYLHPDPIIKRESFYYGIAQELHSNYNDEVIFAYTGPEIELNGDVPSYNFDRWEKANRDVIQNTSIKDLEQKYPKANLWLGAVSERRISDYSYLYGSFGYRRYKLGEIIYFLKAVVLFYQHLFEQYPFDFVLAQHPDNIHSVILFELCKSLNIRCGMLYRDWYWDQDNFTFLDDKHYRSSRLTRLYHKYITEYETCVLPHEFDLDKIIQKRVQEDPAKTRKDLLPRVGLYKNFRNAFVALTRKKKHFSFKRVPIVEGYWKMDIWRGVLAWAKRSWYLVAFTFSDCFQKELPTEPFVYFPLHLQPEAILLASTPVYGNQLAIIQAISVSLPAGFKLVVKDHPKIGGKHSLDFYRQIAGLPNAVLMHESISNQAIVDRADAIITLSGTLGLQGLFQNKLVFVFGRIYYDCVDSVILIHDDLNELPVLLKEHLLSKKVDRESARRQIMAYMKAFQDIMVRRQRFGNPESIEQKSRSYAQLLEQLFIAEIGS